jgi:D-arabinose 1-dehydrogenase-like Zn-dependent alcohol dehydrogenase
VCGQPAHTPQRGDLFYVALAYAPRQKSWKRVGGSGDPLCANCARGWTSSCPELDSRVVSGGRTLGFTKDLGGGWAEQVLAHASMLHTIRDTVPDRAASLHEPVSIACPVTVLARHDHQAAAAAACGADHVMQTDGTSAHFEELARLSGSRVIGRKADVMLMGGFPYVVETAIDRANSHAIKVIFRP